jgi:NitT/TauT family transport system substrate-binding protein
MYLNARDARLQTLDDFNDRDRIAVTGTNTSIPAVIMQKYAVGKHGLSKAKLFDRLTITMTHAEGLNTLLSGSKTISAHFTSPPFHQRELQDPNVHTVINSSQIMNGSTTFNMLSTTTAFYKKNPKVVAAVLAALEQANRMIRDDKRWAAEILFNETPNSKFTKAQLLDAISDPAVKFTIVPENIMEYGEFMHKVGTLEKKPSNWTDMFFPEIYKVYGAQGS